VILDTIADEQWMRNLRHWHRTDFDDRPKTLRLKGKEVVEEPVDTTEPPEPPEDLPSAERRDGKRTRAGTTATR
jgi:hypothetical protein